MNDFDLKKDCTGCRACGDACPKSCISFVEDRDGFIIPSVNKETCINCKRCEQICPALNKSENTTIVAKCYSAYHIDSDIRREGSSGSVFYALAESIIQNGGAVYGAALDDNLQLHHTRATDMHGVLKQMKSKYIQSDTTGIYKLVIQDLQDGKEVLFVGTPCQSQALHSLAPARLRDKLLLVDIVCHGVPSQSLFNQGIHQYEITHSCKVTGFSFREKTASSLRNYKIEYTAADGVNHTKVGDLDDFPYCQGFFYQITKRNSCYDCKQRSINRASDITLGDFWGINKMKPEIEDFEQGYSSVITNTTKGKQSITGLKSCVVSKIKDGVFFVVAHNKAYTKADEKSLRRSLFFFCLRHFGYMFCEKHFLQKRPKLMDRLLSSCIIRLDRMINQIQPLWRKK